MISKQYPYTITKNYLTIKLGYNYNIDKNQCLNRRQRFEWIHHRRFDRSFRLLGDKT